MTKYTIKKGHKAIPWYKRFRPVWKPTEVTGTFRFTESCLYDLGNENQSDINKLVGVSQSLNSDKWSARFGWRANKTKTV